MSECGYGCSMACGVIAGDCPVHAVQAHAMSHPAAQPSMIGNGSVSYTAGDYSDAPLPWHAPLLPYAPPPCTHAEWLDIKADLAFLRGLLQGTIEQSIELRAKIARLTAINSHLRQEVESAELQVGAMYERLRRVSDAATNARVAATSDLPPSTATLAVAMATVRRLDGSDPRFGTQQPEGEPVQPMSARRGRYLP